MQMTRVYLKPVGNHCPALPDVMGHYFHGAGRRIEKPGNAWEILRECRCGLIRIEHHPANNGRPDAANEEITYWQPQPAPTP